MPPADESTQRQEAGGGLGGCDVFVVVFIFIVAASSSHRRLDIAALPTGIGSATSVACLLLGTSSSSLFLRYFAECSTNQCLSLSWVARCSLLSLSLSRHTSIAWRLPPQLALSLSPRWLLDSIRVPPSAVESLPRPRALRRVSPLAAAPPPRHDARSLAPRRTRTKDALYAFAYIRTPMQRRRSYQWLSELVESDTERVVGFQRMFGVQWVTPPNANSMPGAAGAAGSIAGDNSAANSSGLITTASVANSSLGSSSDGINVECVQYVRGHFLIYCLFRFGAFLGEVSSERATSRATAQPPSTP